MISITGDVATGKKILQAAARSVKRTHLELGGKAPVIVFDDADIPATVAALRAFGYYNAGQDCTAACRIYAAPKIYDNLVADLSSAVSTIAYARPDDAENEIGPLISQRQRDRVASFVQRAAEQSHIQVTTGGRVREGSGFFYEPTVIAGALQIRRDRPPRGVRPGRVGNALHRCRRRRSPGRMTRITAWPHRCGPRMSPRPCRWPHVCAMAAPGSTRISCWCNEMPHGGLKQSGYGKDMSLYALEDYTAVRHVMVAHG